jgi:hypothetical protein
MAIPRFRASRPHAMLRRRRVTQVEAEGLDPFSAIVNVRRYALFASLGLSLVLLAITLRLLRERNALQAARAHWIAGQVAPAPSAAIGPSAASALEARSCSCPDPSPPLPAAAIAPAPLAPNDVVRFDVCRLLKDPAGFSALPASAAGTPLIALRCGGTLDVLDLGGAAPQRVLRLNKRAPTADLRVAATGVQSLDLDGDAVNDLVVGFAYWDQNDRPKGGALLELSGQRAGGYAAPRVLAPLAVAALAGGRFAIATGSDIALLRAQDSRIGRRNELVLMRGGPAPLKFATSQLDAHLGRLDAVDLDLDGRSELIWRPNDALAQVLFLDAQGAIVRREPLSISGNAQLRIADLDADGHDDVLLAADQVVALLASADKPPTAQVLIERLDLSAVSLADVDADGSIDVIGVRDDAVLARLQTKPLTFEPRSLSQLANTQMIWTDLIPITAEGIQRLAMFGHQSNSPDEIQLAVVPLGETSPHWTSGSVKLADAPMHLSWDVP